MTDKKLYTEESIESLDPRSFTRLKPQVYCGSTEYSTQLLVEIVSNAVDEVVLGHGHKIKIEATKDKVSVRDYGQGFIVNSIREDGKTVLEAAFSVLNTSGKYRADGVYEGTALGNFGIGAKLPIFLSHQARVYTVRDGKKETITFKEGLFETRQLDPKCAEETGTYVEWEPSEEFFTHTEVNESVIKPYLKTLVCLVDGLEIQFNDETYLAPHGLNQLVDEAVKDKEIINNRFQVRDGYDKYKVNLIMTYTSNYSSTIVPYVNTGLTDSGPHITQIKTLLTREFNKFFRDKGWLKDKDENLTGDDIQEGMYLVFNITSPGVAYDAQVKSRISQMDMKPFTGMISDALETWLAANEKEIKIIVDKALAARKARIAAKNARDNAREGKKKKEKALKFDSKLADCYSKKRNECEIYVTEGK